MMADRLRHITCAAGLGFHGRDSGGDGTTSGLVLLQMGDFAAARLEFRRALDLKPDFVISQHAVVRRCRLEAQPELS